MDPIGVHCHYTWDERVQCELNLVWPLASVISRDMNRDMLNKAYKVYLA